MIRVPVMDRYAKAWPKHAEQPCPVCTRKGNTCTGPDTAEPFTFERAFTERFDDDPHFVAYAPTLDEYRLDHGAIGRVAITMQLLVVDVEPVGHAPRTPEWDAAEQPKIEQAIEAGAYFYSTRGGYRLIWRLAEPFTIASKQDAEDWSASYEAALDEIERDLGIIGDRACKDWTRLYRLPFVTRDGVPQEPETAGTLGECTLHRVSAPPINTRLSPISDDATASDAPPEVLEAVRERLKRHGPAIEGQNGDQHTFEACAIVCRGWGLSDEQACMLLDEWNRTCQPPWDGDELRTKMDNAYNYGSGDIGEARASWEAERRIAAGLARHGVIVGAETPRTSAPTIASTPAANPADLLAALGIDADAPPEDDERYQAMFARALSEVMSYAGAIETSTDNVANEKPFFKSAAELFATKSVPPKMLVERLVMEGGTAMVSGEPKSAKTWLGIEIAIGVATGSPVLGRYKTIPGNVAYFFTEDMEDAIKTRIAALLAGQGKKPDVLARTFHAQPRGHHIDITRAEDCARIIASARLIERNHGKLKLLVLDPLRNIHNNDEDKSGEMVLVFECLKMIGKMLDVTVMLVHHAKKATQSSGSKRGGQKMRGSSAMHGFVDSGLYLDDVRVNDEATLFTNSFESEVKAARSAGKFELALSIEDDKYTHTATKATWHIDTAAKRAGSAPHEVERWEDIGASIVDALRVDDVMTCGKSPGMKRDALLAKVRGNDKAKVLALDWVQREGYATRNAQTKVYRITPKGTALAKSRESRGSEPAAQPEENDDAAE